MAEDVVGWPGCPLSAHFTCAKFSFETGLVKPDPRIYLDDVEQSAVKPEEALFIGDGGDDELAGARSAGLRAAQAGWFVSGVPALEGVPVLRNPQDATRLAFSGVIEWS
jgi:putative hydrolase of the HAD superfamily